MTLGLPIQSSENRPRTEEPELNIHFPLHHRDCCAKM